MIKKAISAYFLTFYSANLNSRSAIVRMEDPYERAFSQTLNFVSMFSFGLMGLVAVIFVPRSFFVSIYTFRTLVILPYGLLVIVGIYLSLRRILGPYRNRPEAASAFGSFKARVICELAYFGSFFLLLGTLFFVIWINWRPI